METNRPLHLKLLMTIVDRGKGQTAVNLLLADGVLFHRIVLGRGTAKTEILDLLGIGETSKDIVLTVLPEWHVHRALHKLKNTLQFDNPGHGIAFTIPISSIGGRHALAMLDAAAEPGPVSDGKENQNMVGNAKPHELIIAIVDSGHADDVMDAARPAGARGGTVLHARGASVEEAEKFFGITIQPEKEMLLILTKHEDKRAIMEAVCQAAGRSTDANGVVFSLPVEDVIGAARLLREEEA
ncbi:MAG: P-II family nitrogen regulator [Firmicutes bacterium]|nr:P-II family nitrogen regulator [Bacillota bacterium]